MEVNGPNRYYFQLLKIINVDAIEKHKNQKF